ncbi:hypothetical protein BDP27DRAFT_1357898 [Rhodocollybia butyracea]|uniref:Uncharacterized protein n=1 Tax=Rhodocollybia butyracea TaxID=206335 RepID=A0A9P5Q179_9AGAR|nr:hypothetical protein BDP27DRAFT_1357898 [Rhodocollybia butyracea]
MPLRRLLTSIHPVDVAKSLGVSAYVITQDFDFTQALIQAVSTEGLYDHLDEVPVHHPPSFPSPTSPLSSLPSSPSPPPSLLLPMPKLSPAPPAQSNARKRKRAKNPATRFVPSGAAFEVAFSMQDDAPVASTSYVGLLDTGEEGEGRAWSLKELVDLGFSLISAEPHITQCAEDAANLIRETRPDASFTGKGIDNRRGNFGNLNAGVAHGGGRTRPANVVNEEANAAVIDTLINSAPFQRLSGYATAGHRDYTSIAVCSLSVFSQATTLLSAFSTTVQWPQRRLIFGPRTVCLPHIDFGNLPFLWCWIWSLGWFNWRKGGHLVLWDFKLVIEFPPGTAIAIPSGICRHGNTRVGKNEIRYSFTQYSSGGNFRWVDHGFQTEEKYRASMTAKEAEDERIRKKGRWKMGLNLFSTLDELGLHT